MAYKRDRAAVEAELQAEQSPYVFYGTPLPPLDDNVRDDGSYVPEWKQDARDEHGRKRFHGAFTGGWSAGYHNTVGSKEGWTPQAFVSSRSKRAEQSQTPQQRPEDFMDEEDLADAAEAKRLQTAGSFAGLGSSSEDPGSRDALVDLVRPKDNSIGVKLLQRMGWRPGQGIGPKVRRKARADHDEDDSGNEQTHLFAPENSKMISFVKKEDYKGLGYASARPSAKLQKVIKPTIKLGHIQKAKAASRLSFAADYEDEDDETPNLLSKSRPRVFEARKPAQRSGMGVGVLNDTGSDDEGDFEKEPEYNRTIDGDEVIRPLTVKRPTQGWAVRTKQDKKSSSKLTPSTDLRRCHDGRLPLDGFVLSTLSEALPKTYPPPKIPAGWESTRKASAARSVAPGWRSTAEAAKESRLDPSSRGDILGEQALPGKSVFDFLTPEARARLVAATGRDDLPAAKSEPLPGSKPLNEQERTQALWQMVPRLDKELALAAISRGYSGFMPYSEDEGKRARYRAFLELKAGLRNSLPERKAEHSVEEWRKEMYEFAHAAEVFKPMSGLMASRFTSSSKLYEGGDSDRPADSDSLLSRPKPKEEDPAEAAARMGMYGPMTRSVIAFYPTRLLCKRFGVRPPAHVMTDLGEDGEDSAATSSKSELVSKAAMEKMMREANSRRKPASSAEGSQTMHAFKEREVVDTERNEALEKDRPADDVFAAIFGDDDNE